VHRLFCFFSFFTLIGCEPYYNGKLIGQNPDLKNLIVYPADTQPVYGINLIQERIFGSTDLDLIGMGSGITVDEDGRVFIGDASKHTVHVFLQDGSYVTSIGREGRGPGEFTASPFPMIISNLLYVYDAMQLRVNVFSKDSFELLQTINLNPVNKESINELAGFYISQLIFRNDGKFLALFRRHFAFLNINPTSSSHIEDSGELKFYWSQLRV